MAPGEQRIADRPAGVRIDRQHRESVDPRAVPAERIDQVRLVAGSIVLTGILASTVVPQAKWLSAGIGAGLTGAALTNTCAMGALLSRMPHNRRHEPTPEAVFAQLRGGRN